MHELSGRHVLVPAARTGPLCPVNTVRLQLWTRHTSRRIPSHLVMRTSTGCIRQRRDPRVTRVTAVTAVTAVAMSVDPLNVTEPYCRVSAGGTGGFNNAQAKQRCACQEEQRANDARRAKALHASSLDGVHHKASGRAGVGACDVSSAILFSDTATKNLVPISKSGSRQNMTARSLAEGPTHASSARGGDPIPWRS
jgi:hypothetical protein